MKFVLPILVVIAMLATLGTLALGLISLARGGDPRRSNKLMQMRVVLQGLAILFFAIFMMLYHR
jgi:ABC-type Na+ efflux pump permease subunit